jgi:hypothetical protein
MGWFNKSSNSAADTIVNFSAKLVKEALDCANAVREEKNKKSEMSDLDWIKVYSEFVNFFLHYTDRFAFGNFDEEKRGKLMSYVEEAAIPISVESVTKDWPVEMVKKIKGESMQNFITSMAEYSKYKKIFPEEGEGTKDTLMWEFGKNILSFAGEEGNVPMLMMTSEITVQSIVKLNPKEFIEKMKGLNF